MLAQINALFRSLRGASEYETIAAIMNAHFTADGLEDTTSAAELANQYAHMVNFDPARDTVMVEIDGDVLLLPDRIRVVRPDSLLEVLLEAARALLPDAGSATFIEVRAGLRPSTPNGLPIIARSPEHSSVIYATGHHRNGILLAPITGEALTHEIVDGTPHPLTAAFRPDRFESLVHREAEATFEIDQTFDVSRPEWGPR